MIDFKGLIQKFKGLHTTKSRAIQRQQWVLLSVVGGVLGLIFWGGYHLLNQKVIQQSEPKAPKILLTNPTDDVDTLSDLVVQNQSQLKKTNEALQDQLKLLKIKDQETTENTQTESEQIKALQKSVKDLESKLASGDFPKKTPPQSLSTFPGNPTQSVLPQGTSSNTGSPSGILSQTNSNNDSGIEEIDLPLPPKPNPGGISVDNEKKNPKNYVPAGSFVKAIMISGVDASAGVENQSDPRPVEFRIVERGTLPNGFKSHLKNCFVTAAAIGDISSGRGFMRLERLSCTKSSGEILDVPVYGYISGKGKDGVLGTPVLHGQEQIFDAAIAGFGEGFGQALQQKYTTNSISPLGTTQTISNGATLQYGAAGGVESGFSKLADYFVKRAEQYQPVIAINAGQIVDIVFLKGFWIDGKDHSHDDDSQSNSTTSDENDQSAGSSSTSPVNNAETNAQNFLTNLPASASGSESNP